MDYRDRYNIIKKIGKGGFSKVYLVTKKDKTTKKYALKVIEIDKLIAQKKDVNIPDLISRFTNEIAAIKKINSKYCIKYYESSLDFNDNSQLFVLTEYVNGRTLKSMIQNHPFTSTMAVDIATKLCEGYAQIHKAGIIHRDIKPENILITNENIPKIIDFGIAVTCESNRVTKEANIIGTTSYFAPEVISSWGEVSVRSDIYSLGLVLYYMLMGIHPFMKQNESVADYEIAQRILKGRITPIYQLNKNFSIALSNCVQRATMKKANDRYSSMTHFKNDLSTCLNPKRVNERPITSKGAKLKRFEEVIASTRFLFFVILILLIIILVLILIGVFG
ncbi:serine/threonine-protein kinase [Mycoplasma phocimorsus]|uniref:non-specific serine/threonine protein kinase n=1 Tax=Mycoplasma phocimorsus TaxID=3045839 RepID=A0AAJ1PR74_9MOLU|nr:serine/threonine-protein kinase [Mycoplasma phocimorsus]MDJ1645842.1 serine/threonine-protein kinase [Mycoplasma phocimorsus]MDJ1646426.1 serine/threonine-protein kinase [Mycoplasma phocimorsus]MDJ1647010.1 serine/threonine-protein kinase [Mycoplasma phocimorsus]MDJ1649126.1 serine/threonine-protein kinase [Mycoplasma phocimorsus]